MNGSEFKKQFGVVLVTVPSKEEAIAIAHALVESKLAACVSILPIQSIYTWQGTVHQEDEWQLLVKSDLSKFTELEAKIHGLHSYNSPDRIKQL